MPTGDKNYLRTSKTFTLEWKRKISDSKKGKPCWWRKGVKLSYVTKKKISKSQIGKFVPIETRILQSIAKGKDGDVLRLTTWDRILKIKNLECERCKRKQRLGIHHKNRNHLDNTITNLEIICCSCHMKEHFNELLKERKNKAGY